MVTETEVPAVLPYLTPREREVLKEVIVEEKTHKCAAFDMGITKETLESHLDNTRKKLGMNGTSKLKDYIEKNPGILSPQPKRRQEGGTGESLSSRETEVFDLLRQGKRRKEVALALGISEHTVRGHTKNIFDKKGYQNKLELIAKNAGM